MRQEDIELSGTQPSTNTSTRPNLSNYPRYPIPNTQSSSQSLSDPKDYFCNAVKSKQKKPPPTSPYPKQKPPQSTSKKSRLSLTKSLSISTNTTSKCFIDCGFVLYQHSKLEIDVGILNIKRKVDLTDPNLFNNLLDQIWEIFSQELPKYTNIKHLPPSVENYISLSQGKSCLTNQESLLYVLEQSTDKKPVQIDLTYQHPDLDDDEGFKDSNSDSDSPRASKPACPLARKNQRPSTDPVKAKNNDQWALGGIACELSSTL
ncbi:hypothetical protein PtB15_4B233 [Puccinia triticina]|nr:hypothetical protein PtB15_4B233 [Puccinia triticina]